MKKCEKCLWDYDGQCVSESETTFTSSSFQTEDCIGFLEIDYEEKMYAMKDICINLIKSMSYREISECYSYIKKLKLRN